MGRLAAAVAAAALAGCDEAQPLLVEHEQAVVLLAVTPPGAASTATVRGAARGSYGGGYGLAAALHACGQRRFTLLDADTLEFADDPLASDRVRCVAGQVAFPFDALRLGSYRGETVARPALSAP